MDSETRFYVLLFIIIAVAIVIGYVAVNSYQAPVTTINHMNPMIPGPNVHYFPR